MIDPLIFSAATEQPTLRSKHMAGTDQKANLMTIFDYLLGSYFYQPDHRLVFSAELYNGVNRRNPNKDRQR